MSTRRDVPAAFVRPQFIPPSAFDIIMSFLPFRDRIAVGLTCKEWREASSRSSAVNRRIKASRLMRDTDLYDFAAWVMGRHSPIEVLEYTHYDSEYNNIAGRCIFQNLTNGLRELKLVYRKNARNRRGIPGPAKYDWVPPLSSLRELYVDVCWLPESTLYLSHWAPQLENLVLCGSTILLNPLKVCENTGSFPRSLRKLCLKGNLLLGSQEPQYSHAPSGGEVASLDHKQHLFQALESLVHLSLEFWLEGHAADDRDHFVENDRVLLDSFGDIFIPLSLTSISLGFSNHQDLQVLKFLTQIRSLKLMEQDSAEDMTDASPETIEPFMALENLVSLWLIGCHQLWDEAAAQAASPNLRQLLIGQKTVLHDPRSGWILPRGDYLKQLTHLAIDYQLFESIFPQDDQGQDSPLKCANQLQQVAILYPLDQSDNVTSPFCDLYRDDFQTNCNLTASNHCLVENGPSCLKKVAKLLAPNVVVKTYQDINFESLRQTNVTSSRIEHLWSSMII